MSSVEWSDDLSFLMDSESRPWSWMGIRHGGEDGEDNGLLSAWTTFL